MTGSPIFAKIICDECNGTILIDKGTMRPIAKHECSTLARKAMTEPQKNPGMLTVQPVTSEPLTIREGPTSRELEQVELHRLSLAQGAPKSLRVYIVGAHAVGKTHLARWISKAYGLPLVTEVARAVLAERELPLEVLRTDVERTAEFQAEVFRRQAIAEDAAGARFVSDRAYDNLAYAASHTIGVSRIMKDAQKYVERLKEDSSVIFFVRPHRELCTAQDGTRERENWEEIIRIDGMVRFLLELHDLDHVVVASLPMAERVRTVRAVLAAHGYRPTA